MSASPAADAVGWAGKVVLVTGASSGIGRAIAVKAAAAGARVAVHFNSSVAGAAETKALCVAAGARDGDVRTYQADLAPPRDGGAAGASAFVGAWRLASFHQVLPSGDTRRPYGEAPAGLITYTADGVVSVQMQADPALRTPWASGDIGAGTPDEKAAAVDTFRGYAGTLRAEPAADAGSDGDDGDDPSVVRMMVHHTVETSLYPNRVGAVLTRRATFSRGGAVLTLEPATPSPGTAAEVLRWERVGSSVSGGGNGASSSAAALARTPSFDVGAAAAATSSLLRRVLADFGRVDVLVNNSGVFTLLPVEGEEVDEKGDDDDDAALGRFAGVWAHTAATNLTSAALLTFLSARHMMRRSRLQQQQRSSSEERQSTPGAPAAVGSIVMIGSRGAFRGEPQAWAYGASKAGLHQLAQSAAAALGRHGIVVAAVAPGFVATPMADGVLAGPQGDAIRGQSPWGRVAAPEEVATAALYAGAYWACPWLSGAILDVNGASYLRH
jgi:3-oxoacyl-[acyl-carrier protein] reductase